MLGAKYFDLNDARKTFRIGRSWRPFVFHFFADPLVWLPAVAMVGASLLPGILALRITGNRRKAGFRLAGAAGRLGMAGVLLGVLASLAIGVMAYERFVR
jgi:hypothetical protein